MHAPCVLLGILIGAALVLIIRAAIVFCADKVIRDET
jgi:hypothetical protein